MDIKREPECPDEPTTESPLAMSTEDSRAEYETLTVVPDIKIEGHGTSTYITGGISYYTGAAGQGLQQVDLSEADAYAGALDLSRVTALRNIPEGTSPLIGNSMEDPDYSDSRSADWLEGETSVVRHQNVEGRGFVCSFCAKPFGRKNHLLEHLVMHTNERPFKCEDCGKTFQWRSSLKRHVAFYKGKCFSCSMCGKSFGEPQELEAHARVHREDRPYVCTTCDKAYYCKRALRKHMVLHGGKTYPCPVCPKSFPLIGYLRQHMMSHSRDKVCDVCGETFLCKDDLYQHSLIHAGKDQCVQCSICARWFRCKSNLRRHMLLHSGEMPYGCKRCDQRFRYKAVLEKHMATHPPEEENKTEEKEASAAPETS